MKPRKHKAHFVVLDSRDENFSLCTCGPDSHHFSHVEAMEACREWSVLYPSRGLFVAAVDGATLNRIVHDMMHSDSPLELYQASLAKTQQTEMGL